MAVYKPNHVEFGRLMRRRDVENLVRRKAVAAARELTAWATEHAVTGNYARSISVHTGRDLRKRDRAAAFIVVSTAYATALEVGSHNIRNPPRPMSRLLDQIRG